MERKYEINRLNLVVPIYRDYIVPNGCLGNEPQYHALFHYFITARSVYENFEKDKVEYVGQVIEDPNYSQLFSSIALAYGVLPQEMAKCWNAIDLQADWLGLPRLPTGRKYRVDDQIIIVH